MKTTDDTTSLTINATAADLEEFSLWCAEEGMTHHQGFKTLLSLTRRERNVTSIFDDDKFAKAFAASRGKVPPDTNLE